MCGRQAQGMDRYACVQLCRRRDARERAAARERQREREKSAAARARFAPPPTRQHGRPRRRRRIVALMMLSPPTYFPGELCVCVVPPPPPSRCSSVLANLPPERCSADASPSEVKSSGCFRSPESPLSFSNLYMIETEGLSKKKKRCIPNKLMITGSLHQSFDWPIRKVQRSAGQRTKRKQKPAPPFLFRRIFSIARTHDGRMHLACIYREINNRDSRPRGQQNILVFGASMRAHLHALYITYIYILSRTLANRSEYFGCSRAVFVYCSGARPGFFPFSGEKQTARAPRLYLRKRSIMSSS